jgi:hypothetical protein
MSLGESPSLADPSTRARTRTTVSAVNQTCSYSRGPAALRAPRHKHVDWGQGVRDYSPEPR